MAAPLALNPDAQLSTQALGEEGNIALIIDDCLADPHQVRSIAAKARYATHGPHYPGLRSPVPQAAAGPLLQPLMPVIRQALGLHRDPLWREGYLSIVTTHPRDLTPIQRIPHFDGTEADALAFLLYLDEAPSGGTAFFRHRSTGFEQITEARHPAYDTSLRADLAQHGLPDQDYIRGSTPVFEQMSTLKQMFNRAVVYRGNLLHCGDLPADFVPNPDPLTGRLTLNIFLG